MGLNTGIFDSSGHPTNTPLIESDLLKKSFPSMITRLMPNGAAPLFGMSSMLKEKTASQPEHGFYAKTMIFPEVTLGAAVVDGNVVAFTVTDSSQILKGMLLKTDSTAARSEVMLVVAVPDPTHVTVQRNIGSTAYGAITNATKLYQVGSAFEEASDRPDSMAITPVYITNYTQIFRNTWALSDSVRATQVLAGESNVAESKQDCAAFHAVDIEKALFFGTKSASTLNGRPFRTMNGIIETVADTTLYPSGATANVFTGGGAITPTDWTTMETYLESTLNQSADPKGSNDRLVFCGGTFKKTLNNIGRLNANYDVTQGQTEWGLQFSTFKTTRGTFRLIEHPLFNSNSRYSAMGVVLDLPCISVAYLAGRKTDSKTFNEGGSAADNGIDAVGGTLTTECTLELRNPAACAVITNVTTAAVG